MNIKRFLKKLWAAIAGFFKNISPKAKALVHAAVSITEAIKDFDTRNPHVADIFTALIPGGIDDLIKNKMRAALPDILVRLRLVDEATDLTDGAAIARKAAELLQSMPGEEKWAFSRDIATLLLRAAADDKLDWKDAVYLVQWFKDNEFKK